MKKVKGYFLLILANFLIYITLSISFFILINIILPAFDIDMRGGANNELLLWSIVIGFGGSAISLVFSKQIARATLQAVKVTYPRSSAEQIVYFTIEELARAVGIHMPEVWIYESSDVNAFATGPTKNSALIAVSTGLLENMDEQEVRAVLAHEIGHVFNGDMFTITILMGLMNTFVYFISQLVLEHLDGTKRMARHRHLHLSSDLPFLPRHDTDLLVLSPKRV
ncbi:MAG: M48 family metalloprotease [bacterium]